MKKKIIIIMREKKKKKRKKHPSRVYISARAYSFTRVNLPIYFMNREIYTYIIIIIIAIDL